MDVCLERLTSEMYITSPNRNGCLCKPVVINISKTYFRISPTVRTSAGRDLELLKQTFQQLGFKEPYIIDDSMSHLMEDPLYSVDNLKKKLQEIAGKPELTKDAEMFFLVVLAFGELGYFYLPNTPDPKTDYQQRETTPPKFSTCLLMSYFNGINCPQLILKPKIFCVQTCNERLKQRDRSLFIGGPPPPQENRVPIEADLLLFHSTISGGYTDKMTPKTRQDLGDVIDQGGTHPACQFVYSLSKAVRNLTEQQEFELNDLILAVNQLLWKFIDNDHYKSDIRNEPWTIDPLLPICVDQLTKKLVFRTNFG